MRFWLFGLLALLAAAGLLSSGTRPGAAVLAGCQPARPHEAGDFDRTIDSGGLTREYLLHVPSSYTGAEATPLVLNFHGLASTSDGQASYSGLPGKADEAGFLLVMPQGLSSDLIQAPHWNITLFDLPEPDDVGFVIDLLDRLAAELCVDATRVFSTGMSNGAMMSSRLACSLSERIAAVAPVAGVYFPPLFVDLPEPAGCPGPRPVPLIAFHGTEDRIVGFDGGALPEALGFDLTFRDIDDEVLPEWAEHNRCADAPDEEQLTEHVLLIRYAGCDEDATVELYAIEGGGHTWPDATDVPALGGTTHEISANDLIWEFFQAHPMAQEQRSPEASPRPTSTPGAVGLPETGTGESASLLPTAWLVAALAGTAGLAALGALLFARRR